jgi:amidase
VGQLPTTVGTVAALTSKTGQYPLSPIDATVVSRILDAGAVVKGTATCESFSASALSFTSATGPVHNAWAHGYSTGGSSSGCGALLGAKRVMEERNHHEDTIDFGDPVELAVGGDQGGSVRIPASYNGIYGLKPTYGLVPYTGVASVSPMIDHLGPMATNLLDVATLLQVMAGYDGIDARMTPESPLRENVKNYSGIFNDFLSNELKNESGRKLRIGLLKESFVTPGMTDTVRDVVWESAKSSFTAAGATVVEISVPMHLEGAALWMSSTRISVADLVFAQSSPGHLTYAPPHLDMQWPPTQEMHELMTATNPAIMNLIFSSTYLKDTVGAKAEAKAHRKIFELRAAYDAALEDVDVFVTPTLPNVSRRNPIMSGADGDRSSFLEKIKLAIGVTVNTSPFNCSGHPALSVPCGFGRDCETGTKLLPIGMQIVGRRWDDETVLKAAAIFEYGRELISNCPGGKV